MSTYAHKSHHVTVLLYQLVFPAKYRGAALDAAVDQALREDHVHFLVQSVPMYCVTKLVTIIKSLTEQEIFRCCPKVRKKLWGGKF